MTTPAPFDVPGAALITITLLEAGQSAQCGLAIRDLAGTDPIKIDADNAVAAWWGAFKTVMTNDTSITAAEMRFARLESPVVPLAVPTPSVGTSAIGLTCLAPYAGLVKWATARGGRSGKGRTYVPGVALAAVNAGGRSFAGGYITAMDAAIASYLGSAAFTGSPGIRPVVISRKAQEANDITGGALATVPGIQRRRMR